MRFAAMRSPLLAAPSAHTRPQPAETPWPANRSSLDSDVAAYLYTLE
jgi:hypothetical protein